jgi:hypothetical protein
MSAQEASASVRAQAGRQKKNNIHRLITAGRHVLVGIINFLSGDGRDNPYYEASAPA